MRHAHNGAQSEGTRGRDVPESGEAEEPHASNVSLDTDSGVAGIHLTARGTPISLSVRVSPSDDPGNEGSEVSKYREASGSLLILGASVTSLLPNPGCAKKDADTMR